MMLLIMMINVDNALLWICTSTFVLVQMFTHVYASSATDVCQHVPVAMLCMLLMYWYQRCSTCQLVWYVVSISGISSSSYTQCASWQRNCCATLHHTTARVHTISL